jgi:hypothetical protein
MPYSLSCAKAPRIKAAKKIIFPRKTKSGKLVSVDFLKNDLLLKCCQLRARKRALNFATGFAFRVMPVYWYS